MTASAFPQDQALAQELERLRTELRVAQQARQQLEHQLAAAQAELVDFAYTVSHDLRANLRHISAYAGLVREDLGHSASVDAGVASYLDTITNSARLMGLQIDGLMALSQLDRASLQSEALDLRALLEQARAALAGEAAGRAIDWQVADDFPAVLGDAALVRQIWGQLLSNALKFTRPRSQAVIQVGWQLPSGATHCTLFVRDNGVGFNPKQQDQLFHVFRRLHSANEFEGVGMGLALTRKLVERMDGEVKAEGELDHGCRVSFTLPLAPQA
jgi:light-regulated signal transduction histidine kinase (bacteriophytochrome)